MSVWCLLKQHVDDFKSKLKDGTIDPAKLAGMTSEERHTFFEKFVGKENATNVNALFESKLLLKNQKAGYISWAKRVGGMSPAVKRDIFSRIERLDKVLSPAEEKSFLHDLASTRLGTDVTHEEAAKIADLSKSLVEAKGKITEEMPPRSPERIQYGVSRVLLNDYVNELKLSNKESFLNRYKNPLNAVSDISGLSKSVLAAFDNSFFGRQGIKALLDPATSHIWVKNFAKSWGDISKEVILGKDAMLPIKADIYSRPNALNGKYGAMKLDIGINGEEAYPTALPGKIPLLGRLYKASESAFNGAALRMRADLADRLIKNAERSGKNLLDPKEAESLGKLINSMTGRGNIPGVTGEGSKFLNNVFFSGKFLKANFDTLTAHVTDTKMTGYAKRQAAISLLRIVGTLAGVYTLANTLKPGSAETDPASANFGKINVFGQWVDVTGGEGSILHLAAQIIPTYRNGEWGLYTKNSKGIVTKLNSGKYGAQTALDVVTSFMEGKLSPVAGLVRDYLKGQNYQGQVPTVQNEAQNLITPLPKQTFDSLMKDPNSSNVLASLILDGLGFSVNPKPASGSSKDWSQNPTKTQQQFMDKFGADKFKQANDAFNSQYQDWLTKTSQSSDYKNLSDQGKTDLITAEKKKIEQKVFDSYHFSYQRGATTPTQKHDKGIQKSLISH